ncbi:Putative neutral zinc metallopeptidase [Flavimaricola marinus]|uniref:Putative neutral zinc metallopeptidase n=2 Tax=Flavimaricola marinus TaxID=1819565 RepID=A0A238LI11_9RHOB|nr:Putative neutral zinc metallopeptidase [Flavimaricola marinus]
MAGPVIVIAGNFGASCGVGLSDRLGVDQAMKWRGRRTSRNIVDRRGSTRAAGIGGVGAVVLVLAGMFFGVDLTPLLQGGGIDGSYESDSRPNTIEDETEQFVGVVLADTEEVWSDIFANSGLTYAEPQLVLYSGTTSSACGTANAAVGPFYCPNDQRIFLDTDFFRVLSQQLGAGGDFAAAYVIAHEVAHHVQHQLGTLSLVNAEKQRVSQTMANQLSVRVELQADCFSGIWAREAQSRFGSIEAGDIAEAMNAAARIGDDALQQASQGQVVPDSFTHGTSAQRQEWFARGYQNGNPGECDTFADGAL